jgi:hypothetical protein
MAWNLVKHRATLPFTFTPMAEGRSSETNSHSADQEIPRLLQNPKVHYLVHKSPPLVPILSHINSVHTLPTCLLRSILILSFHLRRGLPSGLIQEEIKSRLNYGNACYHSAQTIFTFMSYLKPVKP